MLLMSKGVSIFNVSHNFLNETESKGIFPFKKLSLEVIFLNISIFVNTSFIPSGAASYRKDYYLII